MSFTCRILVRFGDVDSARVVYYPKILHYCHVAMEEAFGHAVGVPYAQILGKERVAYPTVRLEAEYKKPLAYGETVEVTVVVERLGHGSVAFRYEGRRASDGALAFVARNTVASVDMDAWHGIRVPPAHRRGLETLLEAAPESRR